MIHPLADCQSVKIGVNTQIWQYAVILKDAEVGDHCNINCHTFIENDVRLGNNVTVKSGVYLWDGIRVQDNVFIGPSVVFTNDLRPRSKQRVEFLRTILKKGCSIGANSSIRAGLTIGEYALVGMGSLVLKDVPNYALVFGSPAKRIGWVDVNGDRMKQVAETKFSTTDGRLFEEIDEKLIKI